METDVRPPLEVETPKVTNLKSAEDEAKENFSFACMNIGRLYYEIDTLQGQLAEECIKARNANHTYHKIKTAETKQHLKEAEVTQ